MLQINQTTLTRKERRERSEYAPILMKLANNYLIAINTTKTPEVLNHVFANLQNQWKSFVHQWNKNPKHVTELRDEDFSNFINDKLEQWKV